MDKEKKNDFIPFETTGTGTATVFTLYVKKTINTNMNIVFFVLCPWKNYEEKLH
jgi:hypothetical protein